MTFSALLRQMSAELLKARRRSLYYGAFGVLLFIAVLPLPISLAALNNDSLRTWARDIVSFPGSMWNTLRLAQMAIPVLVTLVAAGAVGGEYSGGTWKMTLPRTVSRASPLVAKFVVSLLLSLGALAFALALSSALGALGALLLGLPVVPAPVGLGAGDVFRIVAFLVLEFGFIIALTMFASVLTRSLIGGAMLGFFAQHLIRAMTFLPGGWISPMTNLDALRARWMPQSHFRLAEAEAVLGRAMSWQASTATVLAFGLGFCLLAVWLFEKRDLASE
ncbi:ABC transporter permease subunit [Pyxidicoccus sp. 3LG]